jgi:PAS domain S-box-containing protein
MLNPNMRNRCEACLLPQPAEDPVLAHLHNRIAELEDENSNLRQLDETIRNNASLFDALLSRCRDSILLLTPEMTILRLINSVLGYQERELLGENLLSLVHPEDSPAAAEAFANLLDGRAQTHVLEFRARDASGTWVRLDVQMTDMLDDAHVQAIVCHSRRIA